MTFINPVFLWALTALALPVLIHLFNFRKYKKVYFTNVKFLKELQIQSKSRSRLREILVLVLRTLIIACLVLAFSQPVIRTTGTEAVKGIKNLSIYIDNSFSMQNFGSRGPLLEQAKQKAREIIKAYGLQDKFQIITNEFEGKEQRLLSREEALGRIDEVKISSASRSVLQVTERQREALKQHQSSFQKIYLISDAQKSGFDLNSLKSADSTPVALVPLPASVVNNVFLDSCWFENPVQQKGFIQNLRARIVNLGNTDIESGSARLNLNNIQVALSSYSVAAKSSVEVRFTFECKESRFNFGSIKIDDYPVSFDDELFFAFNSRRNITVYLIHGKKVESNQAIESLFRNDSIFSLVQNSEETINYSNFQISDVIILNQISELGSGLLSELKRFSAKGGAIVLIPTSDAGSAYPPLSFRELNLPVLGLKDTSSRQVERINSKSSFYTGVFEKSEETMNLPTLRWHYTLIKSTKTDFEPLLSLMNGDEFLGRANLNESPVFLFTSGFDAGAGNFIRHALFVPTFYRMCFASLQQQELFYTVHRNNSLPLKQISGISESPPHIIKTGGGVDIIPVFRNGFEGLRVFTGEQIQLPGFYELKQNNTVLLPLAFNYNRTESDLSAYSSKELVDLIQQKGLRYVQILNAESEDFTEQVLHGAEAKRLWKLFIILALGFIAAELLILRILK